MNTTSSCNGTTASSIASTNPCCFEEQYFDGGAWNEVDSDHNSHYDSCSNSINNKCASSTTTNNPDYLYWKEPIVVGYAFGPKKMRSMGVVMAEASRVKVIHEELEEDKYDDDDENDIAEEQQQQQQQQHHEVLFCGEDEMTNNNSNNSNSMTMDSSSLTRNEHHHQRTPSLLTRAALRDHCPAPQSAIITLGNTNDTDLQHIVRYFRSSCSSAAASTSIASVSETTVSTPTTTNSYSTNISNSNSNSNNKHQQQQQRRRGGERNRFPVQISFVPIDPDQKIEDQHGGNFDLILHKLTEDILSCSLMQDSIEKSQYPKQQHPHEQQQQDLQQQKIEDDPSWKRVHALRDYCYNQNRNCCLVDDPKHVQIVMSRSEIANVLKQCLKGVNTSSGIPVKSPRFVVIPERLPPSSQQQQNQNQNQTQELKQALHDNNQGGDNKMLSTPLIVKPLIAAGTKQSHCLSIALKESALSKLPPRSIVQEFVNHDATLYKVYVLGDFVSVYERHSLPNLPADLSNATVDLVEFDSQRPYPKLNDFGLDVVEVDNNNTCTSSTSTDSNTTTCNNQSTTTTSQHSSSTSSSSVPVRVPVTVNEVKPIVDVLKKAFGLELFGFDILIGSNNGDCFVVDVNYFPSYKEVPNFPSLLAQYLTQRVLEQRRKGRMYNNINNNNSTETGTTAAATNAVTQEEDYSSSNSESNAIVPPSKSKNDLERWQ
jgi:inositol-1,3,4-trisphosphate 5/6-kinase/inositol-tetrakisphosphate 1-kinase